MAAGLEAAAAAAAAPGRPMGFPAKISPAKGEYLKLKNCHFTKRFFIQFTKSKHSFTNNQMFTLKL